MQQLDSTQAIHICSAKFAIYLLQILICLQQLLSEQVNIFSGITIQQSGQILIQIIPSAASVCLISSRHQTGPNSSNQTLPLPVTGNPPIIKAKPLARRDKNQTANQTTTITSVAVAEIKRPKLKNHTTKTDNNPTIVR